MNNQESLEEFISRIKLRPVFQKQMEIKLFKYNQYKKMRSDYYNNSLDMSRRNTEAEGIYS